MTYDVTTRYLATAAKAATKAHAAPKPTAHKAAAPKPTAAHKAHL